MTSLNEAFRDEAPKQWARTKLGDLYQLMYGKSLTKAARNRDGEYPVYGSNGVVGRHDAYLVEGPVLVIGRKGAAGAVSFCAQPCWPIDTTYYVCPNEHLDIRFSYYLFTFLRLSRFDRSTAIPGLNRDDVHRLRVAIPPLPEQLRIVERLEALFDEIDRGVESLRTAQRMIGLYRQSLLKSAFEGRLTAQWRAENTDKLETAEAILARIHEERVSHYKDALQAWNRAVDQWRTRGAVGRKPAKPKAPMVDSIPDTGGLRLALPELPEGWAWARLGCSSIGPEYGTAAKSSTEGEVPVVRMGNIQNGRINWADLVYTSDEAEIARYALQPGDVLFNRTNSPDLVGKTAIYEGERPAVFAGYLIRVNQIDEIASGPYITHFLNSPRAREHGKSVKTDGVNQSNINGSKLQDYPLPLCSSSEQAETVRILDARLEAANVLGIEIDTSLARAEALRQSILTRAFSGELVPQDPTDEPASVLLARLRAECDGATQSARRRPAATASA